MVFLVPTVNLVHQQCEVFKSQIPGKKIIPLSGQSESDATSSKKVPLGQLVDHFDIFIMTPQILYNMLIEGEISSISVFSLLIFDECHHTAKNHAYNNIMALYHDAKDGGVHPLPQVCQYSRYTLPVLDIIFIP